MISVQRHPGADKLTVCQVAGGGAALRQVVCGAPNVRAGMKAPLALEGARLAGGEQIRRARLRGVESNGMLCSARELGLSEEHEGILELPDEGGGRATFWSQFLSIFPYLGFAMVAAAGILVPRMLASRAGATAQVPVPGAEPVRRRRRA